MSLCGFILPTYFFVIIGGVNINDVLINEQIKFNEVRLISKDGEQLGIMSSKSALEIAINDELDLVLVSPNAKPPVCKIIDYGKYRYEIARREKEAKKKQKTIEIKEIRITPNIEENDLTTKSKQAIKFLEKGNKLKVVLRFRGREMAHAMDYKYILENFASKLGDVSTVDKTPKLEGRHMTMFLVPKKSN